VRPTADRVREALFAWLGSLENASVLDLYAGTGALGIEALSRGAVRAVFVERAAPVCRVLRANLAALGLQASTRVVRGDVRSELRRLATAGERFDLVFLDPPYAAAELEGALATLIRAKILAPGARVIVESSRHEPFGAVPGLVERRRRRYGDTEITQLEAASERRAAGLPLETGEACG
jgi:16S rRNA (guanine(966)-N(2))-methyltransferase RsmD